jgi:hypothetical protein
VFRGGSVGDNLRLYAAHYRQVALKTSVVYRKYRLSLSGVIGFAAGLIGLPRVIDRSR